MPRGWRSTCSSTARGRELGSLAAALGGLDAVVFTAGIGENQPEVRARICATRRGSASSSTPAANRRHGPRISTPGSDVAAWVVPTDEELDDRAARGAPARPVTGPSH